MSIASPTEIPGTVPAARPAGGLASRRQAAGRRQRESPRMLAGVVIIASRAAGNLRPDVRAQADLVPRSDRGRPISELWLAPPKRPTTAPSQLIVSARGTLEVGFAAAVIAAAVGLANALAAASSRDQR